MELNKLFILVLLVLASACQETAPDQSAFRLHTGKETGLDFENKLVQSEAFNVFNYMYFFNGGGVAAGDFNQDGLVDLYFTSNMGPNQFFLNQGDLKFEDQTEAAGLAGSSGAWSSGVSVVDINQDGLLDLYVSQVGDYAILKGKNQLFVNQGLEDGVPKFIDQAADYGLDLVGFGTQAAFFDYDLDGDLDMYQLNHSLHQNGTFGRRLTFDGDRHPLSGDRFLKNENGQFVDASDEVGIYGSVIGYGLGIVTGDVNLDGWPDIYIGNDFHENDYLYVNQKDGTFKEVLTEQMNYTSRFSMGVDMADINNDGWNDIISLDMLPEDPNILKRSLGEDGYDIFKFKLGRGYNPQFSRNNLQLNNGNGTFSEIGVFAGVYATDWSWAPLFLDFDDDGYRDLFISNGIPRRMNDIDYVNFKLGGDAQAPTVIQNSKEADDLSIVDQMPQIKLPNKFYKNDGKLKFQDIKSEIYKNAPSYSNGAVYADFDLDGDLDLVVNNIADQPFLYENLKSEKSETDQNYIKLDLKGSPQNRNAIGARLLVFKNQERLIFENFPVRGYQSSAQTNWHIGLGSTDDIDSILLIWPDLSYQELAVNYNQLNEVEWQENGADFSFQQLKKQLQTTLNFTDQTEAVGLDMVHTENPFVDFNREKLMPIMVSAEGPALAIGDLNQDGLEDFFVGSSKFNHSQIYFQTNNGQFENRTPSLLKQDSIFEDVDATMVDLDVDGDLDLIVASGGNEYRGKQEPLLQRAYINDGRGDFSKKIYFENSHMTASKVAAGDFNQDGLVDLFFAPRAVPWNYGQIPEARLYRNEGNLQFTEVTDDIAPGLKQAGLMKDANWADIDGDQDLDLVLALEWGRITAFINTAGQFEKTTLNTTKGWWNTIYPADVDADGDIDLIAGNFGLNTKLDPSVAEPIRLYVNDFDDNGQVEQVLTYYLDGQEIPFANFAELTKQMVGLKKRFLYAKDLAAASIETIFGSQKLQEARVFEAQSFASVLLENQGDGTFISKPLPAPSQWSPINTIAPLKENAFIVAGNFLHSNIEMGWYEANYGQVLSFGASQEMTLQSLGDVQLKGEVRDIQAINVAGKRCYLVAINDGPLRLLEAQKNIQ